VVCFYLSNYVTCWLEATTVSVILITLEVLHIKKIRVAVLPLKRTLNRPTLAILLVLVILLSSIIIILGYYDDFGFKSSRSSENCSSFENSFTSYFLRGYTHVCGADNASDERLNITVHNYHFADAKEILFHFAPNEQAVPQDEVFLLVNITVQNVGGGNTSIGAGFQAAVQNGTSFADATQTIVNASFPDSYPDQVIPDYEYKCGCLFLPPGAVVNLWLFFNIALIRLTSSDLNQTANFKLQLLTYQENGYGGNYEGYGGFNCQVIPCQETHTEFLIRT
jgi:hypothetical protein